MASNKAGTVAEYLQELPEDRWEVVSQVRDVIRKVAAAQPVNEFIRLYEESRKR